MIKIGVVIADEKEFEAFMAHWNEGKIKSEKLYGLDCVNISLDDKEIYAILGLIGKVNITFEGETRTYALGGPTYDDAYDSVHDVQYAGYEEIRRAWEPLLGRWTAAGDRIIDFAYNGNGDPTITISQGENTGKTGTFEKAMSPLTYELGQWNKLIFSYEKPIEFREIYLDLSGLERDGSINLKQEADGDVYQLGRDDFY